MEERDTSEQIKPRQDKDEDKSERIELLSKEEDKKEQSTSTNIDKSKKVETTSTCIDYYDGIKTVFAWLAFLTGAYYIGAGKEDCPWSPLLPELLLTYGIFLLSSYVFNWLCHWLIEFKFKISCRIFGAVMFIVIDIGLIIWGLVLLLSPSEKATYSEYEFKGNSTCSRNENYCFKFLYLVPMTVIWTSVALYILVGLLFTCRVGFEVLDAFFPWLVNAKATES